MRISGVIGRAVNTNMGDGVWDDVVTESDFIGDLLQRTETFSTSESVNPLIGTTSSVSVLGGGVTREDEFALRYVMFRGNKWQIASVVYDYPRTILYLGGKYDGPVPITDD